MAAGRSLWIGLALGRVGGCCWGFALERFLFAIEFIALYVYDYWAGGLLCLWIFGLAFWVAFFDLYFWVFSPLTPPNPSPAPPGGRGELGFEFLDWLHGCVFLVLVD